MVEQTLEIVPNGQYKNINLKPKLNKGIPGLDNGNHIIVEKTNFAEGMAINGKFGTSYSCRVTYRGEEVSFFLNEKEHQQYAQTGDVGDSVKITLTKEPFVNKKTGVEMLFNKLTFELV